MLQPKPVLLKEHFRNAISQSWTQNGRLHGLGFVISDQAEILIGEFLNSNLDGWYFYSKNGTYAFGTASKNRLEGYNVVKTEDAVVFGTFRGNLLQGVAIIVRQSRNRVEVVEYEKGRRVMQMDEMTLTGTSSSQLISKHFGKIPQTPREFLSSKTGSPGQTGFYQKTLAPQLIHFGYHDVERYLGLIFNGGFLQSFGEFKQGTLDGLGRYSHMDSTVFDGVFKKGEWTQEGVEFRSKEDQDCLGLVSNFRKQYHLKQMDFNNSRFVFKQFLNLQGIDIRMPQRLSGVKELLEIRSRRTTSSFRQDSPLKQKLKIYSNQAASYMDAEQSSVRPYNRTSSPIYLTTQKQEPVTDKEIPEEDIYQFVKQMQEKESVKRTELQEIIRNRTKTVL